MPRYRATTGWRSVRSFPVLADHAHDARDLHLVETETLEPGAGISFCGLTVEVIDADWQAGLGRCINCFAGARLRDRH
jgi:hypothetical protein